ncbi:hypothetical protein ACTFIY_012620 [Dictyostelium cf. discoideum]
MINYFTVLIDEDSDDELISDVNDKINLNEDGGSFGGDDDDADDDDQQNTFNDSNHFNETNNENSIVYDSQDSNSLEINNDNNNNNYNNNNNNNDFENNNYQHSEYNNLQPEIENSEKEITDNNQPNFGSDLFTQNSINNDDWYNNNNINNNNIKININNNNNNINNNSFNENQNKICLKEYYESLNKEKVILDPIIERKVDKGCDDQSSKDFIQLKPKNHLSFNSNSKLKSSKNDKKSDKYSSSIKQVIVLPPKFTHYGVQKNKKKHTFDNADRNPNNYRNYENNKNYNNNYN